jgi:hypothetical protein
MLTLKDLRRHKGKVIFLIADILPPHFSASFIYRFNKYLFRAYQKLGITLSARDIAVNKTESVPVFMGG